MDTHVPIRLYLAALFIRHQCIFELVAVSLRPVALGFALRLGLGERRTLGLGDVSLRPLDLLPRTMGVDAVWLLPVGTQLVVAGTGADERNLRLCELVPAAVLLRLLQLQLPLLERSPWRRPPRRT